MNRPFFTTRPAAGLALLLALALPATLAAQTPASAARQGAAGAIIVHTTPSAGYGWQVVQSSWTGPQFELPAGNGRSTPGSPKTPRGSSPGWPARTSTPW